MTKDQPSILSFFKSKAELPKDAPPPPKQQALKNGAPPPPKATGIGELAPPPSTTKILPSKTTLPAGPLPSPHPSATIAPITPTHIPSLRRLNSLLLPITYSDKFYARLLDHPTHSRAILWREPDSPSDPILVGAIVCRLEPASLIPIPTKPALYIKSLALLSPYRKLGLAEAALEDVVRSAQGQDPGAASVYAHVWTGNEEGLCWYEARGFRRSGGRPVEGYYARLDPSSAWIVRREIGEGLRRNGANGAAVAAHETGENMTPRTEAALLRAQLSQDSRPPPASSPSVVPPTGAPTGGTSRPGMATVQSFQDRRAETEWNDLPADMMNGPPSSASASAKASRNNSAINLLPGAVEAALPSAPSSRSSSAAPRKKRAYPAAAFGNGK